jgi:hypothetical protein
VRAHEGEASARIAAYWLDRQPGAFLAFRRAGRQFEGFATALIIDEIDAKDCAADPAIAAAWEFVRNHGPLRSGERLMHNRFWMGHEYQDREALNVVAAVSVTHWFTTARLAWSFILTAQPAVHGPAYAAIRFQRTPEADFTVGERRFALYAHDWRVEPPLAWMERRGLLEFSDTGPDESRSPAPLLVLSRPDFEDAVRQALREFTRPHALGTNPLLRSRIAAEQAGGAASPATLQAFIREAAAELRGNPRTEKLYRALTCTYLEPAATQELAAERLGLPFNAYRYQLAAAIKRVTERLWQRELHTETL